MEIRMFDESGGICRPLQSQTQQPCIVHWTPLPGPVSSYLFWDTASEAATLLLLVSASDKPMPTASDSSRKKSKHTTYKKKQKRDNLLNRVAMTLQYISGTYKERKRKQNENKESQLLQYYFSPPNLPFMTFLQTMKVFEDY